VQDQAGWQTQLRS